MVRITPLASAVVIKKISLHAHEQYRSRWASELPTTEAMAELRAIVDQASPVKAKTHNGDAQWIGIRAKDEAKIPLVVKGGRDGQGRDLEVVTVLPPYVDLVSYANGYSPAALRADEEELVAEHEADMAEHRAKFAEILKVDAARIAARTKEVNDARCLLASWRTGQHVREAKIVKACEALGIERESLRRDTP